MTTYQPTREEGLTNRKWVVIDAAGVPVGRVASQVAAILRGKNKVDFTPHVDNGDFVIILNAAKVVFTGDKSTKKMYRHHTGFPGGIKEESAGKFLARSPEKLFKRVVKGMLPRGPLGFSIINKLKVYDGTEHPHGAQNPVTYTLSH